MKRDGLVITPTQPGVLEITIQNATSQHGGVLFQRVMNSASMLCEQFGQMRLDDLPCEVVRIVRALRIRTPQPVGTLVQQFVIEILHLFDVDVRIQRREKPLSHDAVPSIEILRIGQLHEDVMAIGRVAIGHDEHDRDWLAKPRVPPLAKVARETSARTQVDSRRAVTKTLSHANVISQRAQRFGHCINSVKQAAFAEG